ncbi:MAG: hypothetical protein RLY14_1968 [Planctomycetota bacterium]|jgi:hypothetical protein
MFKSNHTLNAVDWGSRADIEMIAIDAALSAYKPNQRSPAFAVQHIYKIASEELPFMTREDFLAMFPSVKGGFYKGQMSWDNSRSCWTLEDGPTVDATRIQHDVMRWYLNDWDFSRHARDTEFSYPEDREFAPSGDGIDRLFYALMPLDDELTRRIFVDQQTQEVGYCDVYKSQKTEMYVAEMGFFNDRRTHGVKRVTQAFWELEGFTVPGILSHHKVLSYRVHSICALRGEVS